MVKHAVTRINFMFAAASLFNQTPLPGKLECVDDDDVNEQ